MRYFIKAGCIPNKIEKIEVGGRSTYFSPSHQPKPENV